MGDKFAGMGAGAVVGNEGRRWDKQWTPYWDKPWTRGTKRGPKCGQPAGGGKDTSGTKQFR